MTPTASFTDATGRQWDLRVTAGHSTDLKAIGIDINRSLTETGWVSALTHDTALLIAALHIICGPQKAGVTPAEFNESLDGSVLGDAADALANAILAFSPRSNLATAMRCKLSQMVQRAEAEAVKKISAMDVEKLIASASAGNSAGSSDSTPAT